MHKSIALPQPVKPDTRPRRKVVRPQAIMHNLEPHKAELRDHARDLGEGEHLALEVGVLSPRGLGAELVLDFFGLSPKSPYHVHLGHFLNIGSQTTTVRHAKDSMLELSSELQSSREVYKRNKNHTFILVQRASIITAYLAHC